MSHNIAQNLADLGLPLIELCGPDCPGGSVHGGHDERSAGKAPLRSGWTRQPHRAALPRHAGNWGIPLGAHSGLVCVDTDTEEQEAWVVAHLPATPRMVRTRSGWHRYYRHPGCTVRSAPRKDASGVKLADVKADGGQTVAPGSRHRSGHTYEWAQPWSADDALPVYDEAWFPVPAAAHRTPQDASGGDGRAMGAPRPGGASGSGAGASTWPGERRFGLADFEEAHERAVAYLSSPRTPVSVSGQGGDDTLYAIAVALLRGFPIASYERMQMMRGRDAELAERGTVGAYLVRREDASGEAFRLLKSCWNDRCVAADGWTPEPWSDDRLMYKLEQAAAADRMRGPDFWLFDAKKDDPSAAATGEGSEVIDSDNEKVAQPMNAVNVLSLGLSTLPAQPTKLASDEPIPLGEAGALPSFPPGILRGSVGTYAEAVATSTQTPPDMAYMAALAALSAAARGRFEVTIKGDYSELACLYIAIAAASGERKSAMRSLYAPIREMERELMATAAKAAEQHAARLVALERDLDAVCGGGKKSKAAKKPAKPEPEATLEDAPPPEPEEVTDEEARRNEAAAALATAKREVPPSGRLIAEDATPEALTRVMAGSGGAIALLTDEGGDVFQMMAGGYSDVARLNVYLKSYSGDTLIVDRAGAGHVVISRPALTMGILSQPDTLRKLAHRDISERGLSARFLFALPASLVGERYGEPEAPAPEMAAAYAATVKAIMTYRSGLDRLTIRLSDGARKVYTSHRDDIERRLGRGGDLEATRAWGSKIVGQAIRIAALLHIADVVDGTAEPTIEVVTEVDGDGKPRQVEKRRYPITADAMERAVRLTNEYLIPHARAAFGLMGEGDAVSSARKALDALRRKGIREFGKRDLQRLIASRGKAEDVVDPAIEVLVSHGWIREIEGKRKDSRRFSVHPSAFAG